MMYSVFEHMRSFSSAGSIGFMSSNLFIDSLAIGSISSSLWNVEKSLTSCGQDHLMGLGLKIIPGKFLQFGFAFGFHGPLGAFPGQFFGGDCAERKFFSKALPNWGIGSCWGSQWCLEYFAGF